MADETDAAGSGVSCAGCSGTGTGMFCEAGWCPVCEGTGVDALAAALARVEALEKRAEEAERERDVWRDLAEGNYPAGPADRDALARVAALEAENKRLRGRINDITGIIYEVWTTGETQYIPPDLAVLPKAELDARAALEARHDR